MKGVVFNEFFEMVDSAFGPDLTEAIILDAQLANGGAYTSVGRYDSEDMGALVHCLSRRTGAEVPNLLCAFGRHLLGRFSAGHADYFSACKDVFCFFETIEQRAHVDVLKLYPDAELPRLEVCRRHEDMLELRYRSTRRLADLAEGLLLGAIEHFREPVALERKELPDEGASQCTLFTLTRKPIALR